MAIQQQHQRPIDEAVALEQVEGAVGAAYLAHHAEIRGTLLQRTRDPEAAEDLAQETFLRLTRELRAGRAPRDLRAWLHRVAANLAVSSGRHATVEERYRARLYEPGEMGSPERDVLRHEEHEALRRALATLSSTEQRALVLAAAGWSGAEIGNVLGGRSAIAARTLICRARAQLRGRLAAAELGTTGA
ncbi:MAG TPA: sigma-70 family RNA polymerase sigma factor [Candidatus Limnocylindrales bacterium]|nr:sigma-70 family RNA polymerase sigma factor [Candidatus Limnocylindrales bacterium]